MSIDTRYHAIREKLVALNLELEDKLKLCKLFSEKIEKEHLALKTFDKDIRNIYLSKIGNLENDARSEVRSLDDKINSIVDNKKQLLNECKNLVNDLREQESLLQLEATSISDDLTNQIASEKQEFFSQQNHRLQNLLNDKLRSFKADTSRALAPEFVRIERNIVNRILRLENEHATNKKNLKESLEFRLQNTISHEVKAMKDAFDENRKDGIKIVSTEIEKSESDHHNRMNRLRNDLESELRIYRETSSKKNLFERKNLGSESNQGQDASKKRLSDLRFNHDKEMKNIKKEHEKQIKDIQSNAKSEYMSMIENVEIQSGSNNYTNDNNNSDDDESLRKYDYDKDREQESQIRTEIQKLLKDTMIVKKKMDRYLNENQKLIVTNAAIEVENINKVIRSHSDEIQNMTENKNELIQNIMELKRQKSEEESASDDINGQLKTYSDSLRSQRERLQDSKSIHQMKVRNTWEHLARRLSNMKDKYKEILSEMEMKEDANKELMSRMRSNHDDKLDELNRNIKNRIANYDEELVIVRDALHTEKVKGQNLRKLIQQYIQ